MYDWTFAPLKRGELENHMIQTSSPKPPPFSGKGKGKGKNTMPRSGNSSTQNDQPTSKKNTSSCLTPEDEIEFTHQSHRLVITVKK